MASTQRPSLLLLMALFIQVAICFNSVPTTTAIASASTAATIADEKGALLPFALTVDTVGKERRNPGCLFAYTQTVKIKARDGVELNTIIHFPWWEPAVSDGNNETEQQHHRNKRVAPSATFLVRTPYNAASSGESAWAALTAECYIVAVQDQRGRFASGGDYAFWGRAATDGYDTIAWIASQSWSNGAVYSAGGSADAIAAYMQPMYTPPHLRGQLLAVGTSTVHAMVYQNGAFRQSLIDGWLKGIIEPAWVEKVIEHEAYSSFWDNTTMTNHYVNVAFPSVHFGGWYDIFQQGTIDAFENYKNQGDSSYRHMTYLVFNAHGHCAADGVVPHPDTNASLPVLLGVALLPSQGQQSTVRPAGYKNINFYVMGPGTANSTGDYWVYRDSWPQTDMIPLYLSASSKLMTTPDSTANSQTYIYDPKNPVPTNGGNNLIITCGAFDQRPQLPPARKDVLVFTTAPFTSIVAITGRVRLELFVSSSCKDTDFTAKLLDVYPDGRSINILDGIIRMRWRASPVTPVLMEPGTIYNVTIDLWTTSYLFNPGHAIQIAVSSSNAPRFSPNPNTGELLAKNVTAPIVAKNTVYFGGRTASKLVLPVVNLSDVTPGTH